MYLKGQASLSWVPHDLKLLFGNRQWIEDDMYEQEVFIIKFAIDLYQILSVQLEPKSNDEFFNSFDKDRDITI